MLYGHSRPSRSGRVVYRGRVGGHAGQHLGIYSNVWGDTGRGLLGPPRNILGSLTPRVAPRQVQVVWGIGGGGTTSPNINNGWKRKRRTAFSQRT
eukprot:701488-Pyramimonas_sp.AAC.1